MTMFQGKARLRKKTEVGKGYYHMLLEFPLLARVASPGQFLQVQVRKGNDPLLRRPFGIHRVRGGRLEILFEAVGNATRILSQTRQGDSLEVIGPLGNGFSITEGRSAILVAGGMGVAPLVFLAERLKGSAAVVLLGAKTKNQLLCERDFKRTGAKVKVSTDDGSRGFKGYVSDLLVEELRTNDCGFPTIYACGPRPMLQEVSRIARRYSLDCQISLEAHMACGIGACLGCVIKVRSQEPVTGSKFEYQRVCKDGPVFRANQVVWGKE